MIVAKFGGSSVSQSENLNRIKKIIQEEINKEIQVVVVVSATGDTTDHLLDCINFAVKGEYSNCRRIVQTIKQTYSDLIYGTTNRNETINTAKLFDYCSQLDSIIYGLSLTRDKTDRIVDTILGYGELMSSWLMEQLFLSIYPDVTVADTRQLIVTDETFTAANVDWAETTKRIQTFFQDKTSIKLFIFPGFISGTQEGIPTTLGRHGSDYTASIIGSVLNVKGIYIYTDVDGVMSADPRFIEDAYVLTDLSYEEAIDLAYFGAEVLHPKTMIPAMQKNIPIYIKNSFRPDSQGTVISNKNKKDNKVKTVTSIDNLTFFYLEWNLIKPSGNYSQRLFNLLSTLNIDPWLLNIAPFSQNIYFAVPQSKSSKLFQAIETEFAIEIDKDWLKPIQWFSDISLVSIVGEQTADKTAVSKTLFDAIHKVGTDLFVINKGISNRMISIAIPYQQSKQMVQSIHNAFNLSKKEIYLIQFGKGLVGSALLEIIAEYQQENKNNKDLPSIQVIMLNNSCQSLFKSKGIDLSKVEHLFKESEKRFTPEKIVQCIKEKNYSNVILVDVTASDQTIQDYFALVSEGIHIVSANKKPFTIAHDELTRLKELASQSHAKIRYETTVGAGLPIIGVIQELQNTGDKVQSIDGVFSGSLNAICSMLEEGRLFSDAVKEARERGYTEPHPGEDLSGRDMARKALILAREIGILANFGDVLLQSFIDEKICAIQDIHSFWKAIEPLNSYFSEWMKRIKKEGKTLRYVASIRKDVVEGGLVGVGVVEVGLKEVLLTDPLGSLKGPENQMIVSSKYYHANPLVIKGPGAGAAVTAAGVFVDILAISKQLP